jgi:hypothetical protein
MDQLGFVIEDMLQEAQCVKTGSLIMGSYIISNTVVLVVQN